MNLNIIILIATVWLISRNVGKLFLERRSNVLGARLKTKLVVAFFSFSIIPTLILFIISAFYINSSFDKWFSIKIQNTLQGSLEITHTYYRIIDQNTLHFANHISNHLSKKLPPRPSTWNLVNQGVPASLQTYLEEQRSLLSLHAIEFYTDILEPRVLVHQPTSDAGSPRYPPLPLDLLQKGFAGESTSFIQHVGEGDLIRRVTPIRSQSLEKSRSQRLAGVLVVNSYIPVSLVNKVDEIASVFDDYQSTNPLKYPMKTTYFVILIMITLVIIFVGIWIGLYLAREMTVPMEKLVEGAHSVGSGNLDIIIEKSGNDEISVLVESFNKMTRDLRENRNQLKGVTDDLEKRKLQLEAILANVGTGVIVVLKDGTLSTFNRAVSQLLGIQATEALGQPYQKILTGDSKPLADFIERTFQPNLTGCPTSKDLSAEITQWNIKTTESVRSLAGIATRLQDNDEIWGVIIVIDDMTHLIKAQREVAWREVARRIAHEIKNPLTPIKLSAQRLQRRFAHFKGKEASLLAECTDTIIKHTDELKQMVNEFSNFARFPETSLAPHNLNAVLKEVVSLYSQAHPQVSFRLSLEEKLPVFEFDRDQMKRVFINLVDNSLAAIQAPRHFAAAVINIGSHFNEQLQLAVITVEDNGPGMTEEVRSRVFEPYFSTKDEGTGLGLAIAKRIVNDHDGFIRVQSAPGHGTVFVIELPTARRAIVDQKVMKETDTWLGPS